MRPPDAQLPDTSHFTSQPHARQLRCSESVGVCATNAEIWIPPKKPHYAQIHEFPSQQQRLLKEPNASLIKIQQTPEIGRHSVKTAETLGLDQLLRHHQKWFCHAQEASANASVSDMIAEWHLLLW